MLIYTVENLTAFRVQCNTVILRSGLYARGYMQQSFLICPMPAVTERITQPSELFSWDSTTIRVVA